LRMSSRTCLRVATAVSTVVVFLSLVFSVAFLFLGSSNPVDAAGAASVMAHDDFIGHRFLPAHEDWNNETGSRKTGPAQFSAEGHRMRITPVYQIDELRSTSPQKAQFLEEVVIPLSIESLTRMFSLRYPAQGGPLLLQRRCRRTLRWSSGEVECSELASEADQVCGSSGALPSDLFDEAVVCSGSRPGDCKRTARGAGANDTDFVLVVTSSGDDAECAGSEDSMSAQGGFCARDEESGRPVAGFVNVCPGGITSDQDRLGKQVDLAVHEILHALVFEPTLWGYFRDAGGNAYDGSPVTMDVDPVTGRERRVLTTPKVKDFVRQHFNCTSLDGAELENEGGSGTQWSHWEESLFHDEIMTGLASGSGRSVLSNLTLALMEDSGWYLPEYSFAGLLKFGRNAGCDFVEKKCESEGPAAKEFFCYGSGETGCTPNLLSLGRCEPNPLANGCSIVKGFSNAQCQDVRNMEKAVPLHVFDSSSLCVKGDTEPWVMQTSRGHRGSVMTTTTTYPSGSNGCFAFRCSDDGQVLVNIHNKEVACESGMDLKPFGFASGTFGTCPGPEVCDQQLSCDGLCNALEGYCDRGACHCHLGFWGHHCDQKIVPL